MLIKKEQIEKLLNEKEQIEKLTIKAQFKHEPPLNNI